MYSNVNDYLYKRESFLFPVHFTISSDQCVVCNFVDELWCASVDELFFVCSIFCQSILNVGYQIEYECILQNSLENYFKNGTFIRVDDGYCSV